MRREQPNDHQADDERPGLEDQRARQRPAEPPSRTAADRPRGAVRLRVRLHVRRPRASTTAGRSSLAPLPNPCHLGEATKHARRGLLGVPAATASVPRTRDGRGCFRASRTADPRPARRPWSPRRWRGDRASARRRRRSRARPRRESSPAIWVWWSSTCSPWARRRGTSTGHLPTSSAASAVPTPAWATSTSASRIASDSSRSGIAWCPSMPSPLTSVSPVCHSTSASGGQDLEQPPDQALEAVVLERAQRDDDLAELAPSRGAARRPATNESNTAPRYCHFPSAQAGYCA